MTAPAARETDHPAIGAAILAGGHARRMHGQDKSALDISGRSIIERQLEILRHLTTDLLIVTAHGDKAGAERFARHGVRVAADLVPDAGPLGGLYTALSYMAQSQMAQSSMTLPRTTTGYTLILACDMPFVSIDLLRHLAARVQGWEAAVPRTRDGYHPLCAAYANSVAPLVRDRLDRGELAMTGLLHALRLTEIGPDELARVDPDDVMLSNVNTPHDYRQALSRALNR
jgi:molybdopterin-guanine dinucleotide biosynthesis protein A